MAEKNGDGAASAAAPEMITKGEAVEQALVRLGGDAMPKEIQAEVKREFGLDVSANYVSSIKAEFKAGKGESQKPPAKESAPSQAEKPKKPAPSLAVTRKKPAPKPASAAPASNGKGSVVSIEDVLALKAIVGRVGSGNAKTLIDAISK